MSIISVVGARPNFMKIAPIMDAFKKNKIKSFLVHTGQHYDKNMSKVFFEELGLPDPDIFLGVGSGSHAVQTAKIMVEFEKVCLKLKPELVVVAGDVNSTMACAVTAKKLNISVAHVEAGLRSFDNAMPEEINRILTDHISDILFTTEGSANINLMNEGISKEKIFLVGNCMIDSVIKYIKHTNKINIYDKYHISNNQYCLITLHRPSNVDYPKKLLEFIDMLNKMSKKIKVVFPVHPRTRIALSGAEIKLNDNILLLDPLPYIEFLNLINNSRLVVTDSGGIQEETTYLGVQCITARENTERPVTVDQGTNHLAGTNTLNIMNIFNKIINGSDKKGSIPSKWDGKSSARISDIINNYLLN